MKYIEVQLMRKQAGREEDLVSSMLAHPTTSRAFDPVVWSPDAARKRLVDEIKPLGGSEQTIQNYGDEILHQYRNAWVWSPPINDFFDDLSGRKLNSNTSNAIDGALNNYDAYLNYLKWRQSWLANKAKKESIWNRLKFWK